MEAPVTISSRELLETGKTIKVNIDKVDPLRRRLTLKAKTL
jgi:ribosomal protein S1